MRWYVYPYKMQSEGAIALAEGLGALRIRLAGSTYTPREGDVIVNWGCGDSRDFGPALVINPEVNICINKKTFFGRMQGHNVVPPFAFSADEARRHLEYPIVCRRRIEGADGAGIFIANDPGTVPDCSLYTQLMDKTAEYRVHMGRLPDGTIELICAQKKRVGTAHGDNPIWTGEHVFLDWCDPALLPRPVFNITKQAMELIPELHFGGFDTILTDNWGARVVEVNSAPMMTPDTVRKYVAFLKRYVEMFQPVVTAAPSAVSGTPLATDVIGAQSPGWEPTDEHVYLALQDTFAGRITSEEIIKNHLRYLYTE